jgi:tetratricopeptide (TPR) repeat protein
MDITVHQFRKEGKLNDAWKLAVSLVEKEPDNRSRHLELAWVYYDFLKRAAEKGNISNFRKTCNALSEKFRLEDNDHMLREQLSWAFFKMMRHIVNSDNICFDDLSAITKCYTQIIDIEKPSLPQSLIIKTLLKAKNTDGPFWSLLPWINDAVFRPEDFQHETFNEKKIMPLAERALYAYAKSLTGCVANGSETALSRLKQFVKTVENDPEKRAYAYTDYYLAEACYLLNDSQKAFTHAMEFAKINHQKSWAWALLAKTSLHSEERLSFLSKAVQLEKKETFLLKVRKSLTLELLQKGYQLAARQNTQVIIRTREQNNWPVTGIIENWLNETWFKDPSDEKNLKDIIATEANKALQILFSNAETTKALVVGKQGKNVLFFTPEAKEFSYKTNRRFQTGNWAEIMIENDKIIDAINTEAPANVNGNIRNYHGMLQRHSNFGFADDVFIAPYFLNKLPDGQNVVCEGIAVFVTNKKKNTKGWKAITAGVSHE